MKFKKEMSCKVGVTQQGTVKYKSFWFRRKLKQLEAMVQKNSERAKLVLEKQDINPTYVRYNELLNNSNEIYKSNLYSLEYNTLNGDKCATLKFNR